MKVIKLIMCMLIFSNLKSQDFENQVSYDLGDSFELVEKIGARSTYQTKDGVSFVLSANQNVEKKESVPIIAAMSLMALSKQLEEFEVIYESKEYQLTETIYSFFVYTHSYQGQDITVYSFHTFYNGKMVNLLFTFPSSKQDIWNNKVIEIMKTVEFNKR